MAWFRGHEVKVLAETDDGDCIVEFISYCCDCSSDYGVDSIRIITGKSELSATNQLDEISKEINAKREELEELNGALKRKKRILCHSRGNRNRSNIMNLPEDYDIEDLECVKTVIGRKNPAKPVLGKVWYMKRQNQ